MYFRCGDCLGASWCDGAHPPRPGDRLRCESCERFHRVVPSEELGETIATHYTASLRLSNERSIDIASAYSVLLGILTEERLSDLKADGEAAKGAAAAAREEKAPSAGALGDYDPGFLEAIAAGHLTVQEAIRRGDRKAFAVNLAVRHGLPLATAYAVADKRLSIRDAVVRNRVSKPVPRRRRTDRVTRKDKVLTLTAATLLVFTLSWDLWSRNQAALPPGARSFSTRAAPPSAPAAERGRGIARERDGTPGDRPPGLVDVRRSPAGEAIEIIGPDPRTVLAVFCESHPAAASLEPSGTTETVPKRNEARLGVFRDYREAGRYRAIWMRRDWRTHRWIAGDGKVAIPVRDAPEAVVELATERTGTGRPSGP